LTPSWLKESALYIGIFTDLLKHSPSPRQDLDDMGLNPEWAAFAGTDPYAPDSPAKDPAFKADFYARVSAVTRPRFYLSRPSRLYGLVNRCSSRILTLPFTGYYEKSSGRPPISQPFGLWYAARNYLFPKSMWTVAAFFTLGIAATFMGIRRFAAKPGEAMFVFYGFLLSVALAQFLIPVLTLGEVDLARYLLLFNVVFDAGLILALLAALHLPFFRAITLQKSTE
jgi:hypothetical protein